MSGNKLRREEEEEEEEWYPRVTCNACGEEMPVNLWNGPHLDKEHGGDYNIGCTANEEDSDRAMEELLKLQEGTEDGTMKVTFLNDRGEEVRLNRGDKITFDIES